PLAPRRTELLPRRHPGGRAPHSGRLDQPQGRAPHRRCPSGPGVPDADRARRLADGDALPLARVLDLAGTLASVLGGGAALPAGSTPRAGTSTGHFTIKRPFIPSLK